MMTSSRFFELEHRWPEAYWDEFMRRPDVRKGRHCIRPEVSRSYTFGAEGVSNGQYYDTHLNKIFLNPEDKQINFKSRGMQQWLDRVRTEKSFDAYLEQQVQSYLTEELPLSCPPRVRSLCGHWTRR
jgi:hypothetical protein